MSHTLKTLGIVLILGTATIFPASQADAKRIERACIKSDRGSASSSLCDCIQRVADQVLTGSDQRIAARFFEDPQEAQDIRQSDRRKHEEFWKRYVVFGDTAQKVCR